MQIHGSNATDLDILTQASSCRGDLVRPSDAVLAGLRLVAVGANRINPPGRQDLHRPRNANDHLTWIVHGRVLVREPGPPCEAGAGDVLVMPAGASHRYASTDDRGWRAVWASFTGVDLAGLGLRGGVQKPAPATGRAFAALVATARAGGSGPRLAAALAVLLAELSATAPLRRTDRIADEVAQQLRDDPLRPRDLPALAARHGLSWSTLRQALRRRTGLSPDRLLRSARLALGARALMAGASVQEAARASGFPDPFHFSRLFRRAHGVAPRDWRALGG